MSLREQKAAASKMSPDRRSPSPSKSSDGCMPRGCRCDKICYLRMINYALDLLEGDSGEGLTGDAPKKPNRARALCCCLLITLALVLGLIFSWGYISGYVMAALGAASSVVGKAFSQVGDYVGELPPLDLSTLPQTIYDAVLGLFSSAWAALLAFAGNSFTWFLYGGLLPHEAMEEASESSQRGCMPWDSNCKPSKAALKAMADVETCPDGLVLSGGRATPSFGFSSLLLLFWVRAQPLAKPSLQAEPPSPQAGGPSPLLAHTRASASPRALIQWTPLPSFLATSLPLLHRLPSPALSLRRVTRSSSTVWRSAPTCSWRRSRRSPPKR